MHSQASGRAAAAAAAACTCTQYWITPLTQHHARHLVIPRLAQIPQLHGPIVGTRRRQHILINKYHARHAGGGLRRLFASRRSRPAPPGPHAACPRSRPQRPATRGVAAVSHMRVLNLLQRLCTHHQTRNTRTHTRQGYLLVSHARVTPTGTPKHAAHARESRARQPATPENCIAGTACARVLLGAACGRKSAVYGGEEGAPDLNTERGHSALPHPGIPQNDIPSPRP